MDVTLALGDLFTIAGACALVGGYFFQVRRMHTDVKEMRKKLDEVDATHTEREQTIELRFVAAVEKVADRIEKMSERFALVAEGIKEVLASHDKILALHDQRIQTVERRHADCD